MKCDQSSLPSRVSIFLVALAGLGLLAAGPASARGDDRAAAPRAANDAAASTRAAAIAQTVTIERDSFGVPHVSGPTDASCVFGFIYAQAEDYFWQIEDSYLRSLGRAAEVYGEKSLPDDLVNRASRSARSRRPNMRMRRPRPRRSARRSPTGSTITWRRTRR